MDIQGYIIDHWMGKMSEALPIITIYDPTGFYHELLPVMAERGVHIVDTSITPLAAREDAVEFWMTTLQQHKDARMLIYRKKAAPRNEKEKIKDPYIALAQTGAEFLFGPQDDYINLCKGFIPNKGDKIDEMANAGTISLENINSLLDGANYPELQRITQGQSVEEITVNLLALKSVDTQLWMNEWITFGATHYPGLDCTGTSLDVIKSKLWQYLLFSEFVLDLPDDLPNSLQRIPVSPKEHTDNINKICRAIRNRQDMRDDYVEQANAIVERLNLNRIFADARDLGKIVTFGFENKVEYDVYLGLLSRGDYTTATQLAEKNRKGVWYHADPKVELFWKLSGEYEALLNAIRKSGQAFTSLAELTKWYVTEGWKVDNAYRKFQTLYNSRVDESEHVDDLARRLHSDYRSFTEQVQQQYLKLIADEGYPVSGMPANIRFWDAEVAPLLEGSKRIVVIMADACRYEMGRELADKLSDSYEYDCKGACAFLPSVTRFGMAALLPNAENSLKLKTINGELQPTFNDEVVDTPEKRILYIKQHVPSNRVVLDIKASDVAAAQIDDSINLLIVRSVKIDTAGETVQGVGLSEMQNEMQLFARICAKCRSIGFDTLFIVADHGYMIQPSFQPGDNMSLPAGTTVLRERRCAAGDLAGNESTLTFEPATLGIDADFFKIAYPKQYGLFIANKVYFHEGLSLQENIVPILKVKLKNRQERHEAFTINISYKADTVRMLRPIIQLRISNGTLMAPKVNVRIDVRNAQGQEVGHPAECDFYNETTDVVTISALVETARLPIALNEGVSGDITISALDPETNITLNSLTLHTDID